MTIVFFLFLSLTHKCLSLYSGLFPAIHAANGYYTIIFGGVSLEGNIISLLFIILDTQLVAGITLVIKGIAKGRSPVVKEV
ncbi:hypothetical protein CN425_20035 [Bacillus cereus]|uniref:Uncharacterized protein n=1 Tax=Bacillus cereus TaxID=1396 RepID=A0A2A9UY59_BACCE|nr:hypothetical protein [Bacillus cereus]EJS63693.1 hypothetical protein ICU_04569 [Bacillus cereus BAG2X1-1]EJS70339.1 hypothetical protein ICY_04458 [Bacillus cereus BAG2X1-3]PEA09297.1 hypothetical protein CON38_12375 [Bacillus cereus]PEV98580.1 hypothetical protein CN425_20035 [Bacillus cereus]PFI25534.1 hypothetical protein COI75_05060 [Bacillus cereus]